MLELFKGVVWRSHLPGLLRLMVTLLLLLVSLGYNLHMRSELGVAKANNWLQQDQYAQAVSAKALLDENLATYAMYRAQGIIGSANRLAWVEALREVSDELKLPSMRFTLEESRPLRQGEDANWQPGVEMRVTPMRVDLQVAHEGDVYRLFDELRERAPGIFSIEACKMSWQQAGLSTNPLMRMRGVCDLVWYSLYDVTATWEAAP